MIKTSRERYRIFEHGVHVGYFNVEYSSDGERISAELFGPSESFALITDENGVVTHERIEDWMFERIVPRSRIGIDDLLRQMGLSEYDQMAILKFTSARHTSDTCMIDFTQPC